VQSCPEAIELPSDASAPASVGEPLRQAGVQPPFAGHELTTSVTYTSVLTGSYASDQVAAPMGMETGHWGLLLESESVQEAQVGAPASAPTQ